MPSPREHRLRHGTNAKHPKPAQHEIQYGRGDQREKLGILDGNMELVNNRPQEPLATCGHQEICQHKLHRHIPMDLPNRKRPGRIEEEGTDHSDKISERITHSHPYPDTNEQVITDVAYRRIHKTDETKPEKLKALFSFRE
jgi:hypothetical protein